MIDFSYFQVIGRFSISSVLYEDRGRYRCVASNGNPVETVRSAYGELIVQREQFHLINVYS